MGRGKLCSVSIGFLAAIVTIFFTLRSAHVIYFDDGRTAVFAGVLDNQLRSRTIESRSTHTQVQDWTMLQHRAQVPLQWKPGRYIDVDRFRLESHWIDGRFSTGGLGLLADTDNLAVRIEYLL